MTAGQRPFLVNRQLNDKLTSFTSFRLYAYFSTMCFYNIITQTQSQSCPLPCRLSSKKWLKDFVPDGIGYARSVISHSDLNHMIPFQRCYCYHRVCTITIHRTEATEALLGTASLGTGLESIVDQVQ